MGWAGDVLGFAAGDTIALLTGAGMLALGVAGGLWHLATRLTRIETRLEGHVRFVRSELEVNGGKSVKDRVEKVNRRTKQLATDLRSLRDAMGD